MDDPVLEEFTVFYENRATSGLTKLLESFFGLDLNKGNVAGGDVAAAMPPLNPTTWATEESDKVEGGFIGFAAPLQSVPVFDRATADNCVFLTTSPVSAPPAPAAASVGAEFQSELPADREATKMQVTVGEAIYGDFDSLLAGKMTKLERAARAACIHAHGTDEHHTAQASHVLDVVGLAVLVHHKCRAEDVFDHITPDAYPLLSVLKAAGRLLFVHDIMVLTKVTAWLEKEVLENTKQLARQKAVADEQKQMLVDMVNALQENKRKIQIAGEYITFLEGEAKALQRKLAEAEALIATLREGGTA
jgi:hypothetical protein